MGTVCFDLDMNPANRDDSFAFSEVVAGALVVAVVPFSFACFSAASGTDSTNLSESSVDGDMGSVRDNNFNGIC